MVQLRSSHVAISVDGIEPELHGSLTQLLQSVAAHGALAPDAVAKLIAVKPSELTELARSAAGDVPNSAALQTLLVDIVQVLATMGAVTGSVRAAADWLRHARLREFDGATPLRAVAAGRAGDVCRLIEMYDAGPAG